MFRQLPTAAATLPIFNVSNASGQTVMYATSEIVFFASAKSGFLADIAQNDDEPLENGDLVSLSFNGVEQKLSSSVPLFKVKKTHNPNDPNIIGIAYKHFSKPLLPAKCNPNSPAISPISPTKPANTAKYIPRQLFFSHIRCPRG